MSNGKGIPDFYKLYVKLFWMGWTLKNTVKVVDKAIISRFFVAY